MKGVMATKTKKLRPRGKDEIRELVNYTQKTLAELGLALANHGHRWTKRQREYFENCVERLETFAEARSEEQVNKFKVPKKMWSKWEPEGRAIFNRTYEIILLNKNINTHPKHGGLPPDHNKMVAWNAAWVAAEVAVGRW